MENLAQTGVFSVAKVISNLKIDTWEIHFMKFLHLKLGKSVYPAPDSEF